MNEIILNEWHNIEWMNDIILNEIMRLNEWTSAI